MLTTRRLYAAGITAALAVVAAVVVGVLLLRSGSASNVDLTTAKLVPADAELYVGLNTDLNSTQWVEAFNFAKRLGQSDPQQELHQSAQDDGNLDWQTEVAPFLGGNAGFYVRSFDVSDPSTAQGAAIVRCKDAGRCLSVIESKLSDLQSASYQGVQYRFNADSHEYLARTGDHIILAANEESLHDVLDVQAGRRPSLATVGDFKTLRDDLTNTFLGFVYVNTGKLLADAGAGVSLLQQALKDSGSSGIDKRPSALVIGAKAGSIELQAVTIGKTSDASPLLQPHESRFAKVAPGDTAIFVSAGGLSQTWNQIVKSSRQQIDDTLNQQGYDGGLDGLLQQAGQQIGLNSLQDAIDLFNGEVAVAAWFPSQGNANPEGVLLAEVKNEQQARDLLRTAANAAGDTKPRTERVGGTDVTVIASGDSDLAYTVKDGYLAVGNRKSLRRLLTRQGPSLAEADSYRRTVQQTPARLATFAYFDLAKIYRSANPRGDAPRLEQAAQYLQGAILDLVQDRGISRMAGVVTAQ